MIHPLASHLTGVRLSAFVDGEMAPDEAHRWRLHLMDCWSCTAAVSGEREVRHRVRHSCVPSPPSTLLTSLRVVAFHDDFVDRAVATSAAAPHPGVARPGWRAVAVARRFPVGVVAVTTTAAAAAVVGLAVTGLAPGGGAVPGGSPGLPPGLQPAAAVTGPRVPAALAPAAVAPVYAPAATSTYTSTYTSVYTPASTSTHGGDLMSLAPSVAATIPWPPRPGTDTR